MADQTYQLFTEEFRTNTELLLQQKQSLLRSRVMSAGYVGVGARFINQFGVVEAKAPQGRFAQLVRQDVSNAERWVQPQDRDIGPLYIDNFDLLKTIVDPKSPYSAAVAAAAGRFWDDIILAAAIGTANIGTATTMTGATEAWSTSYDVADTFDDGATSTGLTPAKLIEANRLMRQAHAFDDPADEAGKTLVIGATEEANLLGQVQVISSDFNSGMPMQSGSMNGKNYLGWHLIVSNRLPYASSVRTNIGWVPSGMHLGIWKDLAVRVDQAVWLSSQPYQLYAMVSAGASRTQLGKVVKVKTADTITGDTAGTGGP